MAQWQLPEGMAIALAEARMAEENGEIPVGAAIMRNGTLVAAGHNRTIRDRDPTAHAEIVAIRAAAEALGNARLSDCDLYVTLEPCAMCAGAISHARLARVYYAADDPKGGGVDHGAKVFNHPQCLHRPEVYSGIGAGEAAMLLRGFFARRR